jgi:hypothetical protein
MPLPTSRSTADKNGGERVLQTKNKTKQSKAEQNKTKQSKAKQNKAKQVPEWDSPGTYQRMHHFRMPPKLDQSAGALPRLAPLAPPLLS